MSYAPGARPRARKDGRRKEAVDAAAIAKVLEGLVSRSDTERCGPGVMTINFGTIDAFTSDDEVKQRLNSILDDSDASSGPVAGRALSIAMVTQINSHSGGASSNNEWHFYSTPVGHAVGCNWQSGSVQEVAPQGPSDTKLPSSIDSNSLPWPGGEYKLTIDGADCVYKNDRSNPGRLFCPNREIVCEEDSQKSSSEGMLECNSYTFSHAAVYCDF